MRNLAKTYVKIISKKFVEENVLDQIVVILTYFLKINLRGAQVFRKVAALKIWNNTQVITLAGVPF